MQTISLNLPDDLLARLDLEAKARRMTKSSLVREILAKRFSKESTASALSCYDVARDLAGSVRGVQRISPSIRNTWKALAGERPRA